MNNSKNNSLIRLCIYIVVLVVFNAVFFLVTGPEKSTSMWISYVFIIFSVLAAFVSPYLAVGGSSAHIFGLAIGAVTGTYVTVTCLVNVVLMLVRSVSVTTVLVINIILTGIFLVGLLMNLMANNATADSVARHEAEVQYIKVCSMRLKALQAGCTDPQLLGSVERLYDLIHSSPSKTNAAAQDVELQIITQLGALEANVQAGNVQAALGSVATLTQLANERNRRLML